MHHHPTGVSAPDNTQTIAVPTEHIMCEECAATAVDRLKHHEHVLSVHYDAEHKVAHVQVHEGTVSAAELVELVADACGERAPAPLPKAEVSSHAHAHTAPAAKGGHAHHDMSDPDMAAFMAAAMQRRFWISLVL